MCLYSERDGEREICAYEMKGARVKRHGPHRVQRRRRQEMQIDFFVCVSTYYSNCSEHFFLVLLRERKIRNNSREKKLTPHIGLTFFLKKVTARVYIRQRVSINPPHTSLMYCSIPTTNEANKTLFPFQRQKKNSITSVREPVVFFSSNFI